MRYSDILEAVLSGREQGADEVAFALAGIFAGRWSSAQTAAYLVAMRAKGETPAELAAAAAQMRARCVKVEADSPDELIDTCGTGGDGSRTFNISTAAAFIAAACGVRVAKHGNRAQSGVCGSSDLLAELGAELDSPPDKISRCLVETGICFMFAQAHHPVAKVVAPVRKELGVRTMFNLLGPLANPAGAARQVVGVFDGRWLGPYARTLALLGSRRALVVHAAGLDELSPCGPTDFAELREDGEVVLGRTEPAEMGSEAVSPEALQVSGVAQAVTMFRDALAGAGAAGVAAALNAGAAVYVAGLAASLREGCEIARRSQQAGAATAKLGEFIAFYGAG